MLRLQRTLRQIWIAIRKTHFNALTIGFGLIHNLLRECRHTQGMELNTQDTAQHLTEGMYSRTTTKVFTYALVQPEPCCDFVYFPTKTLVAKWKRNFQHGLPG